MALTSTFKAEFADVILKRVTSVIIYFVLYEIYRVASHFFRTLVPNV